MANELKTYEVVIGYNHTPDAKWKNYYAEVEAKDKFNAVLEATRIFVKEMEDEDDDDFIYPVCDACVRKIQEVKDND